MSSVDFRVEFNDGEHAPEIISFDLYCDRFTITLDEPLKFEVSPGVIVPINISNKTIDEILFLISEMSEMFTLNWIIPSSCSELTNITDINNLISENIPEYFTMQGSGYFEKSGINYVAGYDNGFGLVPEEYIDEIENVLLQGVYSYNSQNLITEYLTGYEDYTDYVIDYNLSVDIDLNGLVLEDGYYEVLVEFSDGDGIIIETIGVTLDGITIPVEEPEEPEEEEEEEEDDDDDWDSYIPLPYQEPIIIDRVEEPIVIETPEEPKEERKINPIVWIITILLVGIAVVTTLVIVVAKSKVKTTRTFKEMEEDKFEDDVNETP